MFTRAILLQDYLHASSQQEVFIWGCFDQIAPPFVSRSSEEYLVTRTRTAWKRWYMVKRIVVRQHEECLHRGVVTPIPLCSIVMPRPVVTAA
jgi:hypothetical protein